MKHGLDLLTVSDVHNRPVDDDCTLSIIRRAKAAGFSALIITLDTVIIGWRPHDLAASYLPFIHGFGSQVGLTDPVFMRKHGEEPILDVPAFPYDPDRYDKLLAKGDEKVKRTMKMATKWLQQTNSGRFRTWDDLKFIRDNWDGPLLLKGIMSREVSRGCSGLERAPRDLYPRTRSWPWTTGSTALLSPTTVSVAPERPSARPDVCVSCRRKTG